MSKIVLLLGSNLGDRLSLVERARTLIAQRVGGITHATTVHQTAPWGYDSPNVYANQIVQIEALVSDPIALLDTLQEIERELGRTRDTDPQAARYTDRTIDVDILYIDQLQINHPRLTVPHPRIAEREFVLALLTELKNLTQ